MNKFIKITLSTILLLGNYLNSNVKSANFLSTLSQVLGVTDIDTEVQDNEQFSSEPENNNGESNQKDQEKSDQNNKESNSPLETLYICPVIECW